MPLATALKLTQRQDSHTANDADIHSKLASSVSKNMSKVDEEPWVQRKP